MTQGREEADEWVSAYSISYSADAFKWSYVVDGYGNRRVYRGNVDAGSVRYNLLDPPLQTRFVRLHVIEATAGHKPEEASQGRQGQGLRR